MFAFQLQIILRGKHCRRPIAVTGVVDHLGLIIPPRFRTDRQSAIFFNLGTYYVNTNYTKKFFRDDSSSEESSSEDETPPQASLTKTTPAPAKKAETPAKKVEKSSSEDSSSDSEEEEPKKTPTDQPK